MLNDKTEGSPLVTGAWDRRRSPGKNAASMDTANCKAPSYRKLPSTRPKNAHRIARTSPSSFLSLPSVLPVGYALPSLGGSGSPSRSFAARLSTFRRFHRVPPLIENRDSGAARRGTEKQIARSD